MKSKKNFLIIAAIFAVLIIGASVIYSQLSLKYATDEDFTDPNTLIYGHNMKNGSMFKTLHRYKDRKFFEENRDVYIYQEGKILKYRIFAAYTYDDRHIMLSFDFEDENIFEIYLNSILTNRGNGDNIDVDISVSTEDRIITLSTCTNNNQKQRYLVQAVLISTLE